MAVYNSVAIIGGTGKVGQHLAKKALENGFKVRMLVRNPNKFKKYDDRIELICGDAQDEKAVHLLLKGCDTVINTLGQPVKEEKPIYSSVTSSILNKMSDLGIKRYIGVTGGSLTIPGDNKTFINKVGAKIFEILFSNMMTDKKRELSILQNSDIEWTLVRLPFVMEGSETGKIKEDLKDMPGRKIMNADIAEYLIDQINKKEYIRKTPFISN
ncbi:NAD(P)-dependent oxidoreductase [Niallia sp. 03133]|uniref:NAD(P)-dependent oxidoreductase n=1 Tax=Niallia sp. 03133 TaxID=3458060 RepID=UPI004044A514